MKVVWPRRALRHLVYLSSPRQKSWQAEARPTWCRKLLIRRRGAGAFACERGVTRFLTRAVIRQHIEKDSEQNASLAASRILKAVTFFKASLELAGLAALSERASSSCLKLLTSSHTGSGQSGWN
jgi:hypothetical protein